MPEDPGAPEGEAATDHVLPSQCSARALAPGTYGSTLGRKPLWLWVGPANPTVQQSDELAQVTELNWS